MHLLARGGSPLALIYFAVSLFVSAFLLFLVQPMIGKMILPTLGGTPQVWNTCMMFFQMALLAGYAYTHTVTSKLPLKKQLLVHCLILLLPLPFLLMFGRPFPVTELDFARRGRQSDLRHAGSTDSYRGRSIPGGFDDGPAIATPVSTTPAILPPRSLLPLWGQQSWQHFGSSAVSRPCRVHFRLERTGLVLAVWLHFADILGGRAAR